MDRKVVAGVAVLALGLVPAGCGGSSKPLTRAQFARKANAICMHRRVVYASIIARSHGDFRRAVRSAMPEMEADVRKLSELKPPTALQSAYREIMSTERQAIVRARTVLAGRLPSQHEDGPPLHRHERLRIQLGMPACN